MQVQYIMKNHSSQEFQFLNLGKAGLVYGRYRTQYYGTLARLLFMESKDTPDKNNFETFMQPLSQVLMGLLQICAQNPQALKEDDKRLALIGLYIDINIEIKSYYS